MAHPRLKFTGVPEWNHSGDISLLDQPTGAILLSRQSRRPKPDDWWVQATIEAISLLARENRSIICGGGILHLDFARWAANRAAKAIFLNVPGSGTKRQKDKTPDWSRLRIEPVIPARRGKVETMTERDKWMVALADKVIAVSVRLGGNMETLGKLAISAGKEVLAIEPPRSIPSARGNIALLEAGAKSLPDISHHLNYKYTIKQTDVAHPPPGAAIHTREGPGRIDATILKDYFWHFTRECAGPWPDQSWDEYFSELADGKPESAHEAIDSLEHILRSGAIKAVGGMVRGGHKVVCLSAKSPLELASNPIYRKALARWDFKPYAIGIRRNIAIELGAKAVQYGGEEDYRKMPDDEKYLFQLASGKAADWRREEEWRIKGDIDLNSLSSTDVLVLVHTPFERVRIEKVTLFPVIVL